MVKTVVKTIVRGLYWLLLFAATGFFTYLFFALLYFYFMYCWFW